MNAIPPLAAGQVGRSIPRLEARGEGHRPRRICAQHAPAGHAVRRRSCAARSRTAASRASIVDAALKVPGVHRIITGADILKIIPHPYYGPAFHDQPILAIGKVHYVGEPVAVVLADDPHVAETGGASGRGRIRGIAGGFRRGRSRQPERRRARRAASRPARSPTSSTCKACRDTNIALDFQLRHGDADKAFAEADHIFEHTFQHPAGDARAARAVRLGGRDRTARP